jgi:hypothetical protein
MSVLTLQSPMHFSFPIDGKLPHDGAAAWRFALKRPVGRIKKLPPREEYHDPTSSWLHYLGWYLRADSSRWLRWIEHAEGQLRWRSLWRRQARHFWNYQARWLHCHPGLRWPGHHTGPDGPVTTQPDGPVTNQPDGPVANPDGAVANQPDGSTGTPDTEEPADTTTVKTEVQPFDVIPAQKLDVKNDTSGTPVDAPAPLFDVAQDIATDVAADVLEDAAEAGDATEAGEAG